MFSLFLIWKCYVSMIYFYWSVGGRFSIYASLIRDKVFLYVVALNMLLMTDKYQSEKQSWSMRNWVLMICMENKKIMYIWTNLGIILTKTSVFILLKNNENVIKITLSVESAPTFSHKLMNWDIYVRRYGHKANPYARGEIGAVVVLWILPVHCVGSTALFLGC